MKQKKRKLTEAQLKKRKRYTILGIIEGGLLLGAIIFLMAWNLRGGTSNDPAIEIGGKAYNLAEFNFYYYAYYNAYLDENTDYVSYMFDQSKSLKEQEYSEGVSWFAYFLEQAQDSMKSILTVAERARAEGFALTEKDKEAKETAIAYIKDSASAAGLTASQYLQEIYGTGMTLELYEKHLDASYLAAGYSEKVKSEFSFTPQELEEYYQSNISDYTYVDYERFYVKACDQDKEPSQEQKGAAYETAQEIHQKYLDGQPLEELGTEYSDYGTYYSFTEAYYDESFSYGDWLFSPERRQGDSNIIDDGKGYYVMVYHSRSQNEYPSVNILDFFVPVQTEAAEDAQAKNEMYEESCTVAEELFGKWQAGERTREAFERLALEYKNYTYNAYEQLIRNTLNERLDRWSFAEGRKEGDCEVLYTEEGFHVLYYVGADAPAWQIAAREDLMAKAYENWYDEATREVKIKCHDQVLNQAGGN